MKKMASKILCVAILTVCVAALSAGSALAADQAPAGTETFQSLFVTTDWLKANLDKVVLIDARAQSLYKGQQGHLPGAVNAEWTYFATMAGKAGDPKWGDVPDAAALAQRIGALGIDGKKDVVVYGDGGDWGNAGWVVWILRMTGMKNARILDGGFTVWRAAGGKTSNTTTTNKAVKYPNAKIDPSYIVTTEWLAENVNNPAVAIIDVRGQKEYTGEIRPFGELRPGHIPGAVNVDMGLVFTPDFTLKPAEELEALFAQAGFSDKEQEIALYDSAGVRSAFMTMVFRLAGYKNARNYDSSYHAWCGNQALEIRQGPNP
ncbi:MAG: sulfurtransferase [Synergistaceae bacterium]|nr:sulfurtransferase [Synergistaceae bacterium]